MIEFAEVSIGRGQLPQCRSCAAQAASVQPAPRSLTEVAADLTRIAEAWGESPGPNCSLVGFEPFAHPELPKLIAAATAAGFTRIRLRTDGGALAQPGNADGALAVGVRQLELIVLAEGEAHDKLTGRPGLYAAMERGAAAFRSAAERSGAAIALAAFAPACRHSISHLPHALLGAASLGAESATIDVSALSATPANVALVRAGLDTATVNRVAAYVTGWPQVHDALYDRSVAPVVGVTP